MLSRVNARRVAAAVVTPVLLVGLVACGGDDKPTSGDAATAAESATPSGATSESPKRRPDKRTGVVEEIDAKDFAAKMSNSFANTTTAKLDMKVSSSGLDMSANGEVDYTRDTPAMALKMTAPTLGRAPSTCA